MDPAEVTRSILMYFILPLWVAAGFADYLCHRAADQWSKRVRAPPPPVRRNGPRDPRRYVPGDQRTGDFDHDRMLLPARGHGALGPELCQRHTRGRPDRTARPQLPRDATPDGSADDRCFT